MHPSFACDGLGIATKLPLIKSIVCTQGEVHHFIRKLGAARKSARLSCMDVILEVAA